MKRLLVDTNVVLDVVLDREPFADTSVAVWVAVEAGVAEGYLSAHSITTLFYLIEKGAGAVKAKQIIRLMLRMFRVATVDGVLLEQALALPLGDFEDAVTAAAAQANGCDFIVTRDPKGFRGSPVRAMAPEAVLPMLVPHDS
jgi:predicted nucleic acid-binding protein